MKHLVLALMALGSVAAAIAAAPASADPETVLITYRAGSGHEADLRSAIQRQWQLLSARHFVTNDPHLLVRGQDAQGGAYFVEVFTWVDASIPDHAPAELQAIWNQFQTLCPSSPGKPGLQFQEVDRVPIRAEA